MCEQSKTFEPIKHPKKRAFLAAFSVFGIVGSAARLAEVDRRTHYNWLKTDPDYAAAFAEAKDDAADKLEEEVWRRAVKGVPKLIVYRGEPVLVHEDLGDANSRLVPLIEQQYSDVLAIFMLKALRPEKYCDRTENRNTVRHVVAAPDGGPPDWLVERAEKKSETERRTKLDLLSESMHGEATTSGV